jgi:hypothetical protein
MALAKGELNFAYWGLGDSEINYDREAVVDANQTDLTLSATSKVFRPFDRQPNIKSFITKSDGTNLNPLSSSNINVVKAIVNNVATERGFFSGSGLTYLTQTGSTYVQSYSSVNNSTLSGGTTLTISSGVTINVGDFIRLKLINNNTGAISLTENSKPLPNLWFKAQSILSGTTVKITVDRNLPNNSTQSGSSYAFIYKGGEVADSFGNSTTTAYWDSGTLSFDTSTNVTSDDVKVWNMNNVWTENLAGITGLSTTNLYENYTKFGSYSYIGSKTPYLEYLSKNTSAQTEGCSGPGYSCIDNISKSISILHYSNNTISNIYGEFFYIDILNNKTLKINIPDLMYHRANYPTASGTGMGMTFVASGLSKTLGTSDIEYYDLYEDSTLVSDTALVVGKVFPQLKMVVIHDDEIVAATSYKSNRNWTLPPLSAFLSAPTGGTTTGILATNKTMYLTYSLENSTGTGLTTTLPCQKYIKITNDTSSSKDVSFKISDVDLLPYMRKIENVDYDGLGFYAYKFKLLYQIVDDVNDRPNPNNWKVYDYTNTTLTGSANKTIDPIILENQAPLSNGFVLTTAIDALSLTFDITNSLSMPTNLNPTNLQFGDERFFYGNLSTYIGATIFKTLFDIRISASEYTLTTNPTRSQQLTTNPALIKATEVGIYDNNKNLVVIGKLSEPVPLESGNTIMLELSMDF